MKRTLMPVVAAVALTLVSWGPSSALAQSNANREKAAKFFAEGEREYTLGRFKEAIEKYQLGFEAFPDQWFLFNIAQSYRQLDDCEKAVFFYKRYLAYAKRPESQRKRNPEMEKQVRETFIPDMEEKCKRDAEMRKKPPDFVERGVTGKNDGSGGTDTGTTGTGSGTTGTGTTAGGDKQDDRVAEVGDDDDDFGDDDDDDFGGSVSRPAGEKPSLLVSNVGLGPSFLGFGADLNVPTQLSLALGAGYPIAVGPVDLVPGALVTYTPVPWSGANNTEGTASLVSILANGVAGYEIIPKLSARAELGLGVQLWSGLDQGNPFTEQNRGTTGALSVFNVRLAIGAEYAVNKNIVVSASPVVYSYSPAPNDMRMDLDAITRFELLVGAGYRM